MRKIVTCFGLALALLGSQEGAKASVLMTMLETGPNVVLSGGGTLNLAALGQGADAMLGASIRPVTGNFIAWGATPPAFATVDRYGLIPVQGGFGPGEYTPADASSGDTFGVFSDVGLIFVPNGYVSGAALSGTSSYLNKNFATLGVTPGTYVWTWGSGATADFISLQIGPAIPEPGTIGLVGAAGIGLMLLRIRVGRRLGALNRGYRS